GAVHGAARVERRLGHDGRLALGAVADTNGAAAATMANLSRLGGVFAREHVDAVLALGDLGRSEDEIAAVLTALGTSARAPVLALAGEREPENAFHAAVSRVHAAGIDVVDLVDTRLVDTGAIDIVSIPGYPFSRKGCHYTVADLEGVQRLVAGRAHPRLVAAHTPPQGRGPAAADWALGEVNAGDLAMTTLLRRLRPAAALFAHVDEAGGRADGEEVNVGAVERGLGVIVELDGARAAHRLVHAVQP
ncbi:MAG TPA: hypothetical protein VF945_05815, partial [Polyangia bacterium]